MKANCYNIFKKVKAKPFSAALNILCISIVVIAVDILPILLPSATESVSMFSKSNSANGRE